MNDRLNACTQTVSLIGRDSNHVQQKQNSKIAVIGGGNIGTQFACVCASKGYEVNVYSSKPDKYDGTLSIADADGRVVCSGEISMVTANISDAVKGCKVVFISYPAFMLPKLAKTIYPYIEEGMYIGVIPGTGGAEFAFRDCILNKGAVLFGIQRVPAVARLIEYGKSVCVEGKRDMLHLASIPCSEVAIIAEFMSKLFDMPCEALPNYLCVTMTPSNPILHTTRLCTMFSDYEEGVVYKRNPLFYGEWSEKTSDLLLACDDEHQQICKNIDRLDLRTVRSLREHYESETVEQLTTKMRSIKSLKNLSSPMKQVEGGWIPDFNSRYFTADFPYGLAIIEELAEMANVKIPNIKNTMNWYRTVTGDYSRLELKDYGISVIDDIYNLYR